VPLFRSWLPSYRWVPAIPDRQNRPPRYPPAAQARGIPGQVVLQFVVDTSGRADLGTVRVLHAQYRDFVEAAVRQLSVWRFRPATADGCPVRALVQQAFLFRPD